ncbi:MAG: hypothetical protein IPJ19_12315 [Planctomycetes bacterium]|nr:hypothetical protein [Planctomycetota bacterium]
MPVNDASVPDWTSLGILLAIVGSFLLGNAILFRPPRVLIEELFQLRRRRLAAVREYVFHRVQVGVGFLYLTGGFALELFGRYQPGDPSAPRSFPSLWAGALLVVTLVLLVAGWFYASHSFRVTLREHFQAHPPDLENDRELARELGELFEVAAQPEDTVESYAARLRASLRLSAPGRRPAASSPVHDEDPFD